MYRDRNAPRTSFLIKPKAHGKAVVYDEVNIPVIGFGSSPQVEFIGRFNVPQRVEFIGRFTV